MRAIACLAVVLMHANGMVLEYSPLLTPTSAKWLTTASALLLFSTPAFAFMSAFLLGHLRGGYHGYFVLIVMQFYIAHAALAWVLSRVPPRYALITAGVVNFGYLMALNLKWFPLAEIGISWYHLFPAWAFYYVLGFYAGRYRESFQAFVQSRFQWIAGLSLAAALVLH